MKRLEQLIVAPLLLSLSSGCSFTLKKGYHESTTKLERTGNQDYLAVSPFIVIEFDNIRYFDQSKNDASDSSSRK